MRHIISILLQNEAGALTRVASMFSTRGYNIDSLSVAPTEDPQVSRLTLVTIGSDAVIEQLNNQLFKIVDVVQIADMTLGDHIERELLLLKLRLTEDADAAVKELTGVEGIRVIDDSPECFTLEMTGTVSRVDEVIELAGTTAEILAVVRSGPMAISRGKRVLGVSV
jgi:acetolactate synthase-1/3 small subunit